MAIDGLKGILRVPFIRREKEEPPRRRPERKKKDERPPPPEEEGGAGKGPGEGRVDIKV
ncbi:MAG: hypothetical protein Kow0025_04320 [Thermodesulfovibrionales bacterium]